MIIVTGSDSSGKTTLVKHINERFNVPIADRFHPLPPSTPSDWQRWYQWVLDSFEREDSVVYDRFLIDEYVYGPLLRGGYKISYKKMADLSGALLMKQPLYIYCCPGYNRVVETYYERDQYVDVSLVSQVIARFAHVNCTWPVNQLKNIHRFNYLMDPGRVMVDQVVEKYLGGELI